MGWNWICDLEDHDGIEISLHRNLGEGYYLIGNKENYGERYEYVEDEPSYDYVEAPKPADPRVVAARLALIKQFDEMSAYKKAKTSPAVVHKDLFGTVLAVNDIVAFNPPKYKGLTKGKITKFTSKGVTVKYTDYLGTICSTNVAFNNVVKK